MRSNFFRSLKNTEDFVIKKGVFTNTDGSEVPYEESTKVVLKKLIAFVESGVISKSENTIWICKNWRLKPSQMVDEWESSGNGVKSYNTFRSQISSISDIFKKLFEDDEYDIQFIFTSQNKERIKFVDTTIDALWGRYKNLSSSSFDSLFVKDVINYCEYSENVFSIDECKLELYILRKLMKSNLYNLLDKADKEKLGYVRNVLNSPLTNSTNKSLNYEKVRMLQLLNKVDKVSLEELKNIEVTETANVSSSTAIDSSSTTEEQVEASSKESTTEAIKTGVVPSITSTDVSSTAKDSLEVSSEESTVEAIKTEDALISTGDVLSQSISDSYKFSSLDDILTTAESLASRESSKLEVDMSQRNAILNMFRCLTVKGITSILEGYDPIDIQAALDYCKKSES